MTEYNGCSWDIASNHEDTSLKMQRQNANQPSVSYGSFNNILRAMGTGKMKWYRCSWINCTVFLILCIVVKHGAFVQASYVLPVLLGTIRFAKFLMRVGSKVLNR